MQRFAVIGVELYFAVQSQKGSNRLLFKWTVDSARLFQLANICY